MKRDKRTFLEYYISLLKTSHSFINSFLFNNDYNSKIIKIDLFFINFTLFYVINTLFFNDDTMHKIYESKGSFDLENQIPITIYSSLISIPLETLLQCLALSNDAIINFKQHKNILNMNKTSNSLIFKLKIKFVFYFIVSFLLLILFW